MPLTFFLASLVAYLKIQKAYMPKKKKKILAEEEEVVPAQGPCRQSTKVCNMSAAKAKNELKNKEIDVTGKKGKPRQAKENITWKYYNECK